MSDASDQPIMNEPEDTTAGDDAKGRIGHARRAHRRYYRWLRLSRLALGAFFLFAVFLVAWLMPWLPGGMDAADYTPQTAFTVYLIGGATAVALIALAFREMAKRDRESLLAWSSVYDEATGLRNRAYFYDRLALECERAQRSGRTFTVFVIQSRKPATGKATKDTHDQIASAIESVTHSTDALGLLGSGEIGLLAFGASRENRSVVVDRLRSAIESGRTASTDVSVPGAVRIGAATYGYDGTDAAALVQAARTATLMGIKHTTTAA